MSPLIRNTDVILMDFEHDTVFRYFQDWKYCGASYE